MEEGISDHFTWVSLEIFFEVPERHFPKLYDNTLKFHWTKGTTVNDVFHYLKVTYHCFHTKIQKRYLLFINLLNIYTMVSESLYSGGEADNKPIT